MRRRIDSGTIVSSLMRRQASDMISARLRPTSLLAAFLGVVRPDGEIRGFIVGWRVLAVPVLEDGPGTPDTLAVRLSGYLRERDGGGCELHWKIVKPFFGPVVLVISAFFLFAATTQVSTAAAVVAGVFAVVSSVVWLMSMRYYEGAARVSPALD